VEPIVVEATRGDVVEARHRVHAAVVHDGVLVLAAGEPDLLTYLRSSAKPLQALPLVRARPDLHDDEIAIACASHLGRPEQLAAVRRLLADAPADERELECGPAPTPIEHNCSGKHAGFLALCRANGWPSDGYRLPAHPCQRAMSAEIATAAGVRVESIPTAVDGCGVVTFALPLAPAARAFLSAPRARGRGPRRDRDARPSGVAARARSGRCARDPPPRRLGCERRRRGSLLRVLPRRARACAQGRGRGVPRDGSRVVVRRKAGPREIDTTNEFVALTPPTAWTIRGVEGPVRGNVDGRIEPLDGGTRSRVTIDLDLEGHGLGKLLVPLVVKRQVSKEMPQNVQRLKQQIEKPA
jgi:L-asparaginase II/Polyketide cyclase / dehydrase and lipid transport